MTKNLRLKNARERAGLSQQELADKLPYNKAEKPVSQSYIAQLEKDKGYSLKQAKLFSTVLGVTAEWLYFGDENNRTGKNYTKITNGNNQTENSITNNGNESNQRLNLSDHERPDFYNASTKKPSSNAITLGQIIHHDDESPYIDLHNGNFLMVVPKIPIRASAGYRENYQDENYINTQFEKHYFTVPGNHYRGKYFAFVIEGDSMENYTSEEMAKDSIPDGSTVTGREIGRQHWKNKFHLKSFQDYIIVHNDAIFAKRITHHDTENGIITCNSLNPDKARHPDFNIELDECLQILNIVDVSRPR